MPSDVIQHIFTVGDTVNVPCVVSAIGGTPAKPALTLTTVYKGFDGNTNSISVDSDRVIQTW